MKAVRSDWQEALGLHEAAAPQQGPLALPPACLQLSTLRESTSKLPRLQQPISCAMITR